MKLSRFSLMSVFVVGVFFSGLSATGTFKTLFTNVDVFLFNSDFNVYDHARALEKQEISFDDMKETVQHIFDKAATLFLAQQENASVFHFLEHCFGLSDGDVADRYVTSKNKAWPLSSDRNELSVLVAQLVHEICSYINLNKAKILTYESCAELKIICLSNNVYGHGYRVACYELNDQNEQKSAELDQIMQLFDDFEFGSSGEDYEDFLPDEIESMFQQDHWDDFWAWLRKMRKWVPYMLL